MREAFSYMFKDNLFKRKWVIYFVFSFFSAFCINLSNVPFLGISKDVAFFLQLLGMVFFFIPAGYMISSVKTIILQKENIVLPMFNYKKNFFTGFKYCVSNMLLIFVVLTVNLILSFIVAGLIAAVLKVKAIVIAGIAAVMILSVLFLAYYFLAFVRIFIETEAWTSFLKLKKAKELIKKSSMYNRCFGLFMLVNVLMGIISVIVLTIFGKTLILFILASVIIGAISAYAAFINMFIMAKAVNW